MALQKISEILGRAEKGNYAVTAFDTFNFETINWAIRAAEAEKTDVIIMIYPEMTEYIPVEVFAKIVRELAETTPYGVGLMLDHGNSFELAMRCIHAGFTSVMVDFSALDFEENVRQTAEVVKVAHAMGVDVEAEIGHTGDASCLADYTDKNLYTDPTKAKEFVERTGVDVLAIAFGSAHGNYVKEPKLDLNRLKEIDSLVDIPLVLHGGTGIPDEQIKQAVKLGIRKLNVGTGYDQTIYRAVAKTTAEGSCDPYIFSALEAAAEPALAFLREKIRLTRY